MADLIFKWQQLTLRAPRVRSPWEWTLRSVEYARGYHDGYADACQLMLKGFAVVSRVADARSFVKILLHDFARRVLARWAQLTKSKVPNQRGSGWNNYEPIEKIPMADVDALLTAVAGRHVGKQKVKAGRLKRYVLDGSAETIIGPLVEDWSSDFDE